jgi:hypothetical protein
MNPSPRVTKRIYLAGPMQGYPQFNFPRFNAVASALRSGGHEVFNPAEKDIERHGGTNIALGNATGSLQEAKTEHGFSLRQALSEDLAYICTRADTIALLPGWEKSNGAQAEHRTAVALMSEGMEIIYLTKELCELMEQAMEIASA